MSVHGITIDHSGLPAIPGPAYHCQRCGDYRCGTACRNQPQSIGEQIIEGLEGLAASLRNGGPVRMTTVVRSDDGRFNRQPDPTPVDIAAGCESIQATWSDRERSKRAAAPVAWQVPEVRVNLEGDT